jgi:hypothetical protein
LPTTVEIVPSEAWHVRELSGTLRKEDIEEAAGLGLIPHRGLFLAYRKAVYRKTVLVNGKVAAMFGLHGELLGNVGYPYLITGWHVYDVSTREFIRIYKEELEKMRQIFPRLENYVLASYTGAVRMLEIAGFNLDNPIEYNSVMYRKFSV